MRFASTLFVAVSALAVSAALLAWQRPAPPRHYSVVVAAGDENLGHRLTAKAAAARRLADGELTVLETAACFRDIEAAYPTPAPVLSQEDKDLPAAERYCRMAIRWAVAHAQDESAGGAEAVSRRLNAELDAALAAGQPLELPAVP